jgi:hypothetical protein
VICRLLNNFTLAAGKGRSECIGGFPRCITLLDEIKNNEIPPRKVRVYDVANLK